MPSCATCPTHRRLSGEVRSVSASRSSTSTRPRSASAAPSGVACSRRVVRCSRRTPSCFSRRLQTLARDRDRDIEAARRGADGAEIEHAQEQADVAEAIHRLSRNTLILLARYWQFLMKMQVPTFWVNAAARSGRPRLHPSQGDDFMEYRHLGRFRLQGSGAELRHRHLRRQGQALRRLGQHRRRRSAPPRRHLPRCRRHACSTPPTSIPTAQSEEILGAAIKGRRDQVLISTKATFRMRRRPERRRLLALSSDSKRRRRAEAARHRLHRSLPAARLRRQTPVEETLSTLDDLVRAGKIRYIGCSNFSGWHLMKSLAVAGPLRLAALRRAPGLLLADRPRLRMGADAARPRSGRRRGGLEPARLGPAHRQDPPRPAAARAQPPARQRRNSGRRSTTNICSASSTRSTTIAKETGKTHSADRAQLAAAAADRVDASSSARATRSSSGRTSARSAGI